MRDIDYMKIVNKKVFELIKDEKDIDSRIAEFVNLREFKSDDKLLIRYNKRDAKYNPVLTEGSIYEMEKLQAQLKSKLNVFTNLTQDDECIYIVVVCIPKAPLKEAGVSNE